MARSAYSLLLRLATPFYLARLWWRGRAEPVYRSHWIERLGGLDGTVPPGRLWLHAVSLGETRAAAALIDALRAQRPGLRLLLTHGTATGRAAGAALLREGDGQAWLPYDTPGAVRRFLHAHRPALGVVMETEIWPNLMAGARAAGVPMVLANARLSERSRAKGERLAALLHPALAGFACALAQTEADAARLRASGALDAEVLGNLKYDLAPPAELVERGRRWRQSLGRAVVLAASTREGEEMPLLRAWRALPAPRPLLLLVPRHPQRFDEVAQFLADSGLSSLRRSGWGKEVPPPEAAAADVWLGDTLGEMALYAALADVALLGGSWAPLGGQNLIELAACACPVVMGPHTFNFEQAAELALQAGAARRAGGIQEGVALALTLATGPEREAASQRALAFAAAHRGAAARMANEILARLPAQPALRVPAGG
ncbi:3-deoxy-D-manno-octulosonic acid transferase [Rubrivivax sp. A210]|nr:3-deoxy-D-manno-octulosonic acid transferase [Rubrivivax sp. A210]